MRLRSFGCVVLNRQWDQKIAALGGWGLGVYPLLRVRPLAVSLLQRVTFSKRRKGNPKGFAPAYGTSLRLSVPSLRCPSGGIAYGLLRCTSSRCVWLRQTALRAYPGWTPSLGLPKGQKIKSQSQSQSQSQSRSKDRSLRQLIGVEYICQVWAGCQAAFASRLAPTMGVSTPNAAHAAPLNNERKLE